MDFCKRGLIKPKLLCVTFFTVMVILIFAGCPDSTIPPPEPSELRFDLAGATAIYAVESASNSRAVTYSDDVLFKVLEDGIIAPIMDISQVRRVPNVLFIAHSPDKSKKDIYIAFRDELIGNDGEYLGNFFHVREDGSVTTLMSGTNGGESFYYFYYFYASSNGYFPVDDFVVFDAAGNLYFVGYGNSGSPVVYKYDLASGKKTSLTKGIDGIASIKNIKVSSDGSLLFVHGSKHLIGSNGKSISLRVFSTSAPGTFKNICSYNDDIYDDSRDDYVNLASWALDANTYTLYLSGKNLTPQKDGKGGIYKVSVNKSNLGSSWSLLLRKTNGPDNPNWKHYDQAHSLNVNTDGRIWGFIPQGSGLDYKQKFSWLLDSPGGTTITIPAAFVNVPNRYLVSLTKPRDNLLYFTAGISQYGYQDTHKTIPL
ncbi:hypothetical protein FACS1894110_11000 [Spirochaetia bacterium]|nr:hypothetical protein FACS1894110_11000 [Spirochaetia bacterium]